ncbi:MAG: PAS domain-containing protein [Rhodospirillales bacterium]|nr:PAS domain-containing protein [Rhodospirillales bacterium]MBO6786502.1 PAS domain-containing protein [Rhodospirillales bacterium]
MDLDAVSNLNPDYRLLIEYWRERRREAALAPYFRDFELMDLYSVAARIVIVDAETSANGAPIYRWRYAGSELREFIGVELTGRYLHDTADELTARDTENIYAELARNGGHHFWERKLGLMGGERSFLRYSRLVLPLLGADDTVRHYIGLYVMPFGGAGPDAQKPETWSLLPEK